MTENTLPSTLGGYISWWPQTYEIIGLYNDEHRLIPSSIKEIEEFEEQSVLSARKDLPELVEEVADIYIMLLQLAQLLDVQTDSFLSSLSVTSATIAETTVRIRKGKERLQTYAQSVTSNPNRIISITHDILSAALTFSEKSGFSATGATWLKAQYNMTSMPREFWQVSYVQTKTAQKDMTIQQLFSISRRLTKDHQKKHYPKEDVLYPVLQRHVNSARR